MSHVEKTRRRALLAQYDAKVAAEDAHRAMESYRQALRDADMPARIAAQVFGEAA